MSLRWQGDLATVTIAMQLLKAPNRQMLPPAPSSVMCAKSHILDPTIWPVIFALVSKL